MRVIYRALLRLYPQPHRNLLGAEMEAIFVRGAEECRGLGPAAYARFLLKEAAGVVLDAAAVRFAEIRGRSQSLAFRSSRASEQDLPEEVLAAQSRLAMNLNRLLVAISRRQFVQARFYSDEERRSREELRQLRERYGLGDT